MISIASPLRERARSAEIMDGSDYHEGEYERTLRELEWINRFTGGYAPTLQAVAKAARLSEKRPLRILDVGYGYGDTLREIRRWSRASGIEVSLYGIDLNPSAKRWAEAATPDDYEIHFEAGDVFQRPDGKDEPYDLVINSLMMHHLTDRQIIEMLRWMTENARVAWFINDLHRHPVAFYFTKLVTRVAGFGRLVQNDAPLSIAKSFTRNEWISYLTEACVPLESVSLRWHWAFRYGVFCRTQMTKAGE